MLFNNESLPDHMTMKRLWLSHWFGKVRYSQCHASLHTLFFVLFLYSENEKNNYESLDGICITFYTISNQLLKPMMV